MVSEAKFLFLALHLAVEMSGTPSELYVDKSYFDSDNYPIWYGSSETNINNHKLRYLDEPLLSLVQELVSVTHSSS